MLEAQSVEAAVKCAADSIRKTHVGTKRRNSEYAIVVKIGYDEIQKLRDDGYGYDIICKTLSENGTLDVDASPKNLCTAFLRERKRRQSRTHGRPSIAKPSGGMAEKSKAVESINREAARAEPENEQTKKLGGRVISTGLGNIIKNTDGSFDYDN